MKKLWMIFSVVAMAGPVPAIPEPAYAQAAVELVCMTGVTQRAAGQRPFVLPVPVHRAAAMEARGFAARPCTPDEARARAELRAEVCQLARSAPLPVQQRFEQVYGIAPAELCAITSVAGDD